MEKWEGGWLEAEDHNLGAVFQSTLGCEERIGAAFPQNDSQFSRPCIPAALSKRDGVTQPPPFSLVLQIPETNIGGKEEMDKS